MANPASRQMTLGGVRPLDVPAYIDGICSAICAGWSTWQSTAVAPPTPNVPSCVGALSMSRASINKPVLKMMMVAQSATPQHANLFEAIAQAFSQSFEIWLVSTMVTNVLGTGPVPTFAPPYIPVGPVIGGIGNMIPGGFV